MKNLARELMERKNKSFAKLFGEQDLSLLYLQRKNFKEEHEYEGARGFEKSQSQSQRTLHFQKSREF
jgi:hypothetical protein